MSKTTIGMFIAIVLHSVPTLSAGKLSTITVDEKLRRFLVRHEQKSNKLYYDINGIPHIGIGANLKSQDVPGIFRDMGINYRKVLLGRRSLTDLEVEYLFKRQVLEKERFFNRQMHLNFPNTVLTRDEKRALISLVYNSPKLLGPRLKWLLNKNYDYSVTKEILLRSNRKEVPGIQVRRLEEARLYAGKKFRHILKSLKPWEKKKIRGIIYKLKNKRLKRRILQKYKELAA